MFNIDPRVAVGAHDQDTRLDVVSVRQKRICNIETFWLRVRCLN